MHAGLERLQRRRAVGHRGVVKKLPGMSEQDYARLVMASIAQGGHHHHDGSEDGRSGRMAPTGHDHH
jgi:hypothetical protein